MEFTSYIIYYPVVLMLFVLNCFADSRPTIVSHRIDKVSDTKLISEVYESFELDLSKAKK